jgi:hypothetical protein
MVLLALSAHLPLLWRADAAACPVEKICRVYTSPARG